MQPEDTNKLRSLVVVLLRVIGDYCPIWRGKTERDFFLNQRIRIIEDRYSKTTLNQPSIQLFFRELSEIVGPFGEGGGLRWKK